MGREQEVGEKTSVNCLLKTFLFAECFRWCLASLLSVGVGFKSWVLDHLFAFSTVPEKKKCVAWVLSTRQGIVLNLAAQLKPNATFWFVKGFSTCQTGCTEV